MEAVTAILLLVLLGAASHAGAKKDDATILLAFKQGITHDPLHVLHSWDAGNLSAFCQWPGVVCSRHSRLTQLNLGASLLEGSIAPELGGLAHLSSLRLYDNRLSGHIPASLSNCSRLITLSLYNNSLIGSIPSQLGFLHRLQALFLWANHLTGSIPPSLGNCTALVVLELDQNQLSGSIPAQLGKLSHLQTLTLYQNELSGSLPRHLGNCTALQVVRLGMNQLDGFLPPELWQLPHISSFWAYGNKIAGASWENLGNCTSLAELELEGNKLTGSMPAQLPPRIALLRVSINKLSGFLPRDLGTLHELQSLRLGGNHLSGTIPSSLGNCSQLIDLDMSDNQLVGTIPPELGKLQQIHSIELRSNNLNGHIPREIGNCTELAIIDLGANQLEGYLPNELGTLIHLQTLFAGQNLLTGGLPLPTNWSNLQALALNDNLLTGSLSTWPFGDLHNLHLLIMSSNYLSGSISTSVSNCISLQTVDLSGNDLTGYIPSTIGILQELQQLNLSYNNLTGTIPQRISYCTQLSILDLSHNRLNGALPANVGLLQQLYKLSLGNNLLTSVIPESLQWCSWLVDLDLSHNNLNGTIPESFGSDGISLLRLSDNNLSGEIPASFGNLSSLESLILSKNMLVGTVPPEFAHLDILFELDLAYNNLTGTLPPFLGNMTMLKLLNISYNEFTGPIPDSGLFVHLDATSFLGNPELCGLKLRKSCPSTGHQKHAGRHHINTKLLAAIAIPAFALLLLCILGVIICHSQKCMANKLHDVDLRSIGTRQNFTHNELMSATAGFDGENVIGEGSQSVVYRGVLADGKVIAVKKLKDTGLNQDFFFKELEILGRLRHRNLVKILGYVSNLDVKALVMEFMEHGSLEWHLYGCAGSCQMGWETRLRIAKAVANGLVYLHHDYGHTIIHGDLKPSNILLDSEWEAHVADFGIARLASHPGSSSSKTAVSNTVKGSIGYMAPEYAYAAQISSKVDVYSYGVVLLEMLTLRKPTNAGAFGPDMSSSLRQWVQSCFPERATDVLDETLRLTDRLNHDQILQVMRLALTCTEESPNNRPTMRAVLAAFSKLVIKN